MKSSKEILELEKTLGKLENLHASFDYLRITIASPTRIKKWSERTLPSGEIIGEVLKPETINFRTHQPEVSGLFCEKIFGPIKNWKCKCGKYNGFVLDKICEECHVEIIEARVRRYRMGHIDLTCPVTHFWYLKGVPNYLCILLKCIDEDISLVDIEQIVYFKEGERIIDPQNPLFPFFRSARTETELNELQKLITPAPIYFTNPAEDGNEFSEKKELIYNFDYYGSYPYYKMLKKQEWTKKKSWAIKWYAYNFIKNNYSIYFKNTLVKNIGLDGSGVNCKIDYQINQKKFKIHKYKIKANEIINENIQAKRDIAKYLKKQFSFHNKLKFFIKKKLSWFGI
jgi:DNA-directed RNA polymerase beta' subunit